MPDREVPTREKVLEVAKRCPETKKVLEILFPDDFKEDMVKIRKGACFRSKDGVLVLLASIGTVGVTFIDLNDGNFWFNPWQMDSTFEGYVMPKKIWDLAVRMDKYLWQQVEVEFVLGG
jgi:hypothetical protein